MGVRRGPLFPPERRDDGDERTVGVETKVLLRSDDAYVVPRGVWRRLESVEPSYLVHLTPGPNAGHRPRISDKDGKACPDDRSTLGW
jgi:hypothetical protein